MMLSTSSLALPVAKPPKDMESEFVVAFVLLALLKLLFRLWPVVIEANSSAAYPKASRFWYDEPGLFE